MEKKYNWRMAALLDIIVAIHNVQERGRHLQEILAKAIRSDTQFIIVSDSKTESDHLQVRQLIEESIYSSSKFLFGNFGGPGAARNAGLSASESEWICFLDSDDDIDLAKVHSLVSEAERNDADVAIGGLIIRFRSQQTENRYFINSDLTLCDNLSLTPAFTRMVFRRSFLDGVIFPNFRMAEDQCFVFDLFKLSPRVFCSEIYFYTYNLGISLQVTKDFASLEDLSKSVNYIFGSLRTSNLETRQMATTMIIRQSLTFLSGLGLNFNQSSLNVWRTLLKVFVSYPVMSMRSIFLIKKHRPRGFS
jgi:glycosyltransferase involved in cell wall biosynthesis